MNRHQILLVITTFVLFYSFIINGAPLGDNSYGYYDYYECFCAQDRDHFENEVIEPKTTTTTTTQNEIDLYDCNFNDECFLDDPYNQDQYWKF
jgi:hypothetical protein